MKKDISRIGVVTSDKMDKSVVVAVEALVEHSVYKKVIRRTSKFMAHDERNECSVGDQVLIVATRPLSKRKTWRVKTILRRAVGGTIPESEGMDQSEDTFDGTGTSLDGGSKS